MRRRLRAAFSACFTLTLALSACLSVEEFDSLESTLDALPTVEIATLPADDGQIPVGETGAVASVIDGDTIDVDLNGQTFRVRYIGINTPERDEPCYNEATQANADLVANQTVRLVQDISNTDQFDRLLRYVYVGDVFVNAELVGSGWAESVRYPPDTFHADAFDALAAQAKAANLGCYPTGVFDD